MEGVGRERQTDRQTDRRGWGEKERQTDRQTGEGGERKRDIQTDGQIDRDTRRERKKRLRQPERLRQRTTAREAQKRVRETEKERWEPERLRRESERLRKRDGETETERYIRVQQGCHHPLQSPSVLVWISCLLALRGMKLVSRKVTPVRAQQGVVQHCHLFWVVYPFSASFLG